MRRAMGIGACIALIFGAGTAIAGDKFEPTFPQPENQFEGRMKSDPQRAQTYIGFDVKRRNGRKVVRNVFVRSRFACPDISGYEQFPVKGGFRVRRGEFGGVKKYVLRPPKAGTARVRVKLSGKLKGKRARGEFKFKIRSSAKSDTCLGPKRKWRARRGAEIEPVIMPPPKP